MPGFWIGIAAFVLFALIKEEMALLTIVFAVPFLLARESRRLGVWLFGIAGVAAIVSFGLMEMARTPFNRGNTSLIRDAVGRLTLEEGLGGAMTVALPVAAGAALASVVLANRRRLSTVDLGVALVVAAKLATLGLVYEQLPSFSWHLAIPLAGAWYLVYRTSSLLPGLQPRTRSVAFAAAAGVFLAAVLFVDVRWYAGYDMVLQDRRDNAVAASVALEAFAPIVGEGVVSVPAFDLHAWRDREVVVAPRGVTLSPRGISDGLVTGLEGPPPDGAGCLTLAGTTATRALYVRAAGCDDEEDDRKAFEEAVGLPDPADYGWTVRRISNTIELAKASWKVLQADKELLLLPVMSTVATIIVIVSFLVPLFASGLFAEEQLQGGRLRRPVPDVRRARLRDDLLQRRPGLRRRRAAQGWRPDGAERTERGRAEGSAGSCRGRSCRQPFR